jgi:hypothetical protein
MRTLHPAAGRGQSPLRAMIPNAIFFRAVTGLAAAEDQTPALLAANQLRYGVGASGTFHGYEGVGYGQFWPLRGNINGSTPSLFVVPSFTPTQKVLWVNSEGKPHAKGASANLQSYIEEVPIPELAGVPSGRLTAEGGTDQEISIWQPSTGKYWEFWRWGVISPPEGYAATCQYAGYIANTREWNGILPNKWGARATSLALTGGLITLQDLVEVLEGGKIKHALGVSLDAIAEEIVAPATRHDLVVSTNTVKEEGGKANPAYGTVDAVAESRWFRFPSASKPSEFGLTKMLEVAVFEAVREYGLFVDDGGSIRFSIESPVSMGSQYAFAKVNPLAGATGSGWTTFSFIPAGMTNPLLGHFEESISGTSSCFTKQPWRELEALEPRTS